MIKHKFLSFTEINRVFYWDYDELTSEIGVIFHGNPSIFSIFQCICLYNFCISPKPAPKILGADSSPTHAIDAGGSEARPRARPPGALHQSPGIGTPTSEPRQAAPRPLRATKNCPHFRRAEYKGNVEKKGKFWHFIEKIPRFSYIKPRHPWWEEVDSNQRMTESEANRSP